MTIHGDTSILDSDRDLCEKRAMEWFIDQLPLFLGVIIVLILNLAALYCLIWYSRHPEDRSLIYVTPSPFARFLGIVMLIGVSLMVSFQAVKSAGTLADFESQGITVKGKITNVTKDKLPIVHFVNQEGKKVKFIPPFADSTRGYAKGQNVDIVYIPDTKHHVIKGDSLYLRIELLTLIGASTIFILALVLMLLAIKWEKQKKSRSNGS